MKQTYLLYPLNNGSTHLMRTAIRSFQYGIVTMLLVLSCVNICHSQPTPTIYSVFQTDSIISIPLNERPSNFQICFDGSKNYIVDENSPKNQILLRNASQWLDDTLLLALPDTLLNSRSRIQSISMNKQFIVISVYKNVFLFQRIQNSAKYVRFYEVRFPCNYIRILNNTIVGISSKISNINHQNKENAAWLFRIPLADTAHYYDGVKLIEPIGLEFDYFAPQVHVAITDSVVMIADIVNYQIRIYNHYGNLIDSLSRSTPLWFANRLYIQNTSLKDSLRSLSQYPKNCIELIRPYFDSIRVLRHIAMLNNNQLLVAWQLPDRWIRKDKTIGPPKMEYDVWKYENNKWSPSSIDLTDILPEPSDSIASFNNNTYLGFNYYSTDEGLYRVNRWIPEGINTSPLTYNDVYRIQDSIAAIDKNCFALFRIRIKPNDSLVKANKIEKSENQIEKMRTDSLVGCTINSSPEKLYSPDSTTAVLLLNDYNCHDCIIKTIKAVEYSVQHTQNPVRVLMLTRTRKSMTSRKEAIKKYQKIYKDHQLLFDCPNSDNDSWPPTGITNGVFGMFGVSKTPVLIVIHKNQTIEFMNYEKIDNLMDNPNELRNQIDMAFSN